MKTKREAAADEARLAKQARETPLPARRIQMRLSMTERLYCLIRRNRDGSVSRYWVARYTVPGSGRVREVAVGQVDLTTLKEARKLVEDRIARPLDRGVADPVAKAKADAKAAKESAKGPPKFGEVFEKYIDIHKAKWSNSKTVAQWQETGEKFCAPIADKPVADITVDDVLAVLEPHWTRIPNTMARVRARIESVLSYAMARELRPRALNPAAWRHHLEHMLPSPTALAKKTARNFPALPYAEVADLMTKLAAIEGSVVALAARFTLLTAARSGEVRFAKWDHIDLKGGFWTVPAENMKARRPHTVPLSPQAIDVLRETEKHRCGPYVFVGDVLAADGWRHPISDASMLMCVRTLHPTATLHGTARSSFKDWSVEATPFDNALSELALAHKVGTDVERRYRRTDQREQRRALMCAWADYIAASPAPAPNVVPIRRPG